MAQLWRTRGQQTPTSTQHHPYELLCEHWEGAVQHRKEIAVAAATEHHSPTCGAIGWLARQHKCVDFCAFSKIVKKTQKNCRLIAPHTQTCWIDACGDARSKSIAGARHDRTYSSKSLWRQLHLASFAPAVMCVCVCVCVCARVTIVVTCRAWRCATHRPADAHSYHRTAAHDTVDVRVRVRGRHEQRPCWR